MSQKQRIEAERLARKENSPIKRVVRWLPLGVAGAALLVSGLAWAGPALGHDSDLVAQREAVAARQEAASSAEKKFDTAYDAEVDGISSADPTKVREQRAAVQALIRAAVSGKDVQAKASELGLDAKSPFLAQFAAEVQKSGIPNFGPATEPVSIQAVLVRVAGTSYRWDAQFRMNETDSAHPVVGIFTGTFDADGKLASAEAHWGTGAADSDAP